MSESKDVALRPNPLAPQTFDQLKNFADMICRSEFVPPTFRGKAGDVLAAVQYGNEIGLKPMQALQNVAVINGKPSIYGDALLAVCQRHPLWAGCDETFDEATMTARCEVRRKGQQPTVQTFSQADAQLAGLWGKAGPWRQYPKRMLKMRARGFALRDAFADATKGLITYEEALDYPDPKDVTEDVKRVDDPPVVLAYTSDEFEANLKDMEEAFERGEGADWWKANAKLILEHCDDEQTRRFHERKDELKAAGGSGGPPPSPQAPPDLAPAAEGEGAEGPGVLPEAPPSISVDDGAGSGPPDEPSTKGGQGDPESTPRFPRLADEVLDYEKDQDSVVSTAMKDIREHWKRCGGSKDGMRTLFERKANSWRASVRTEKEGQILGMLRVKFTS